MRLVNRIGIKDLVRAMCLPPAVCAVNGWPAHISPAVRVNDEDERIASLFWHDWHAGQMHELHIFESHIAKLEIETDMVIAMHMTNGEVYKLAFLTFLTISNAIRGTKDINHYLYADREVMLHGNQ